MLLYNCGVIDIALLSMILTSTTLVNQTLEEWQPFLIKIIQAFSPLF